MITQLSLRAYAKINLGLDVIGQREDGYHEVRMIMQTVRLYDRIVIRRRNRPGITVRTNLSYLPVNENNLVYRAARLLMDEFSVTDGVTIDLKKVIPVAAGLAGGSSDAAAVLFGINRMFRLGLGREELMERSVALGADVPYCILRGTALAEGIGERLTPLPKPPACQVLLAKPDISISTRSVYENLHVSDLMPEDHPDIDALIRAIETQDFSELCESMGNILETVTQKNHPEILAIKDFMREQGAEGALMSGSGPTVFGLFSDAAAAGKAFEKLRYGSASGLARQVWLTEFFNNPAKTAGTNTGKGIECETKEVEHGYESESQYE